MDLHESIKTHGLHAMLKVIEYNALAKALGENKTHGGAARALKLGRTTFIMMIKRHGLYVPKALPIGFGRRDSAK